MKVSGRGVGSARSRSALLVAALVLVFGTLGFSAAAGHSATGGATSPAPAAATTPSYAVGLRVLHLVDRSRTITLAGGRRVPRTLTTLVRYPAVGRPGRSDLQNAPALNGSGPFPLIVFGHGFAVTPRDLLQVAAELGERWVRGRGTGLPACQRRCPRRP